MQVRRPQFQSSAPKRQKTGFQSYQPQQQGYKNQQFIEASCEVCGENAEIKEVEVKKEGPNQGRHFYSCKGCNGFKWKDECVEGEPIIVERNKNTFLDKSTTSNKWSGGKITQIRDQYTKEFRNPQPYQSNSPQKREENDALFQELVEIKEQLRQNSSMIQQLANEIAELVQYLPKQTTQKCDNDDEEEEEKSWHEQQEEKLQKNVHQKKEEKNKQ